MKLWMVGQYHAMTLQGSVWEFQGVFNSEELARDACHGPAYFIVEVVLNESLPDETVYVGTAGAVPLYAVSAQ